jgi:hypothetical protein
VYEGWTVRTVRTVKSPPNLGLKRRGLLEERVCRGAECGDRDGEVIEWYNSIHALKKIGAMGKLILGAQIYDGRRGRDPKIFG